MPAYPELKPQPASAPLFEGRIWPEALPLPTDSTYSVLPRCWVADVHRPQRGKVIKSGKYATRIPFSRLEKSCGLDDQG